MRGNCLTVFVIAGIMGTAVLLTRARSEEADASAKSAETSDFTHPSDEEPFLEASSLKKAAVSLDNISLAWVKERNCGSCHTGFPYMMSRAVIKDPPTAALIEIREFFESRITNWDADELKEKHVPREIVGTSAALAIHDSQTSGKLHPVTRQSLDRMWTIQRADGTWDWPKCSWPPFEYDDYYGAVLAAVGVGHAPDHYADSEAAKEGLKRLKNYLKSTPPPNLHHKTWLLWASLKLDGLISVEEQRITIKELQSMQRSDGGWSMESLGKEWVGQKGEAANPDAPSDGYGTGLVVFVLRRAGVPANDESIRRGKNWLTCNQRVSGRWFTRSLNGVREHYISDTGTAFAVLALNACE